MASAVEAEASLAVEVLVAAAEAEALAAGKKIYDYLMQNMLK